MPIVTSVWAFVKIIYSKKYDEMLSIRKKQLEDVYGYLRLLCYKYFFGDIKKGKLKKELKKCLYENYFYIEDSVIKEISKLLNSKNDDELKDNIVNLTTGIDKFYDKLRRKCQYKIKVFDETDRVSAFFLIYLSVLGIAYVLMGILGFSDDFRNIVLVTYLGILIIILFIMLGMFIINLFSAILNAVCRCIKRNHNKNS